MRLELQGIQARHHAARAGSALALADFSLQLAPGEQAAVIGPSGAGKTTLLQVAAAALKPLQGQVALGGQAPWGLNAARLRALRGRLCLAPQTPPLPPRQRVVTAVLAGRLPLMTLRESLRSLFYPHDIPAAHQALDAFDLSNKLFDRVDRLSGGERQRVGLARVLLSPATLWLIDEPLSALDPTRATQAMTTLLNEASQRQATVLASLHQVDLALAHFPRIIGLREGRTMFDLSAAAVTPALLARLYAQHEEELHGRPVAAAAPLEAPLPTTSTCR
jgi:phosphonate transport system ATP-binding protein